ncbi:MAG: protein kinase [Candidatus Sumerlaeaceae bacterium]|nr:protein kinase [Candidatus Sumerlaeaceae bacterium]
MTLARLARQTMPDAPKKGLGPDRTMLFEVPTEIAHYKLARILGRGGMGEVWQAFDTKLERDIALKVMRRELLANEEAVKRFYREARAVARLNHPNIVQVYSIGEEHGMIYMVMEMIEGDTVTQKLKAKGRLSIEESVDILLQTIEGLGYANARGIIHRDIKPSNLMLTPEHRIKIADFGLAKMIEHDSQMTAAGTTMGSPNYMSPEQCRGEEADHRSDIYALGISFYQMLTGDLPFNGETPLSVLLQQIQDPLPETEHLKNLCEGRAFEVLQKMCAKKVADRYQTYNELAVAVGALAPQVHVRPSTFTSTATHAAASEGEMVAATPTPAGFQSMPSAGSTIAGPTQPGGQAEVSPKPGGTNKALLGGAAATIVFLGAAAIYLAMRPLPTDKKVVADDIKAQVTPPPPKPSDVAPTPTQTSAVAPVPTAAPLTPAPAPTVTATPVPAIPAPTVVTGPMAAPVSPTLAPSTPTPTSVLATPIPTPLALRTVLQIGPKDAARGMPIKVYDESNQPVATLAAGTAVDRYESVANPARYKFQYNGNTYFVAYEDAHVVTGDATGSTATNDKPQYKILIVGSKGGPASEVVVVYADENWKREVTRLNARTEVNCIGESTFGYKIQLPDGRTGHIFKKNAQPKP